MWRPWPCSCLSRLWGSWCGERPAGVGEHAGRKREPVRDRTIAVVKQLGRRRWKQVSGYHRQGRVENTFFRYTSIIGDGLRARSLTCLQWSYQFL